MSSCSSSVFIHRISLAALTAIFPFRGAATDNLQLKLRGAEAVMAELPSPAQAPSKREEGSTRHRGSHHFRDELAVFRRTSSTIPAPEAAQTWLHLADTFFRRSSLTASTYVLREREDLPRFDAVLAALPPVNAWADLAQAIERRPLDSKDPKINEFVLKLLGARLANDIEEETRIKNRLGVFLKAAKSPRLSLTFEDFLQRENLDPKATLEKFNHALESYNSDPRRRDSYIPPVETPDLVDMLGLEKAKPLVVKALLSPIPKVNFDKGKSTRLLAEACTIENVDRLVVPRWYIAARLGSPALFEALEKRFGAPRSGGPLLVGPSEDGSPSSVLSEYKDAYGYHILNLVIAGKQSEAIERALAASAPQSERLLQSGADSLSNRGHADEIAEFLHGVLTQKPELPWWGTYVEVAARAGQSSEALNALRSAADDPRLAPSQKQKVASYLAQALLADDQVDAAVSELKATLVSTQPNPGMGEQDRNLRKETATKLLKIGTVLDQRSWVDAAANYLVPSAAEEKGYWEKESIAAELVKAKRYRDAETVLVDTIKAELHGKAPEEGLQPPQSIISLLAALANLYQANGYNSDVLALLDRSPYWGASDLSQLETDQASLLAATASALIETGSSNRAIPLLNYLIKEHRGLDRGYELWLKTDQADVEKQLDALATDDPFEERPLIWKADYLRRSGRLDKAEKACRAAIVIDPSDGEQPAGDRLRVYAILAEIREAQGDADQAKTYRSVVQAIRLAEKADQLFQAGLLRRAIALYNKALSLFSDAYCIQSRLAIRLAESGKMQEAEEHYRRAYELMPDSFGRIESHCFGCEHAFGPANAQTIAERVFTLFVEKNPTKPQVHYLLGFLRSEQDRPKEAFTHFREAARLDPDYLNAWKKISGLENEIELPATDLDLSVQNILRLDPRGKHASPPFNKVRDLKIVFREADLPAFASVEPPSVYPLIASAAIFVKPDDENESYHSDSNQHITRESIVRSHPFFEMLTTLVQSSAYPTETEY